MELPSGKPAWPAKIPSSEGVPVEVVGRPSMDEGRTPVGVGGGGARDGFEDAVDTSPSAGVRESAMLRLRKAIVWCQSNGGGEVLEIVGGWAIRYGQEGAKRHFSCPHLMGLPFLPKTMPHTSLSLTILCYQQVYGKL